jgi:hypothetical protein
MVQIGEPRSLIENKRFAKLDKCFQEELVALVLG